MPAGAGWLTATGRDRETYTLTNTEPPRSRAGATGDAISFVCETYAFCLPDVEEFIGAKIPVEPVTAELLAEIDPRRFVRTPRRHPDDRRQGHGHGHSHGHGGRHKSRPKSADGEQHKAEGKDAGGAGTKKRRRRRGRKPDGAGGGGDSTVTPQS